MLNVLAKHEVEFIVIGGIAGRAWGSPTVTQDLDVCIGRVRNNLVKLSDALNEVHATFRDAEDVAVIFDAKMPENLEILTLETDFGNFDILLRPAGTDGYSDLVKRSELIDIDGIEVQITALEDLIRMKNAAGRKKDRVEVEILRAVLDEQDSE